MKTERKPTGSNAKTKKGEIAMKKALVLLILSISLAICLTACDWQLAFGWLIDCDEPIDHTHEFGEWSVTERPTSTKEGLQERICSCGERESETIAKLPAGYSVGLDYKLNEDGQSYSVSGIGDCTDRILVISPVYNELPVTKIDNKAFRGRTNLSRVVIPDGVVSIGASAFSGCISLTNIEIPDSVTSIGEYAFAGCTGLTRIVIPDSVVSIGDSAFYRCKYIRDVYISDLEVWCNIPFDDSYSNPMWYGANLHLNGELVTDVTIPNTVMNLGNILTGCISIVSVTVPDSVTCIGDYAFYGCTGLESVVIPDSVTVIGEDAFRGCTGLESLVIPDSVTTIEKSVFYCCENLTDVVIPDSVTDIGDFAFYGCTELTGIVIPDSVKRIGQNAFRGCDSLVYNEYDNAYYLGGDLNPYLVLVKAKDTAITSCEINPNTKFMLADAFEYCTSLASIVIPDSVASIGDAAFRDCIGLTSVVIGDGVASIGYATFDNCTTLTSVVIGDSVASIGFGAFNNCTALTSVVIGDSVTSIDLYAFQNCDSLTNVYYTGTEAEWTEISIIYGNDDLENATIHYNYLP